MAKPEVKQVEPIPTRHSVIERMQAVAPPGQQQLDSAMIGVLRSLTGKLLSSDMQQSHPEYQRFLDARERKLDLPTEKLKTHIEGKTILVTGGTGCIGSALLTELSGLNPARVVSVSRGITKPTIQIEGVDYLTGDVRDKDRIKEIVHTVQPDIIYHLAAQRDPGLAENALEETLSINILGTRNIIDAAKGNNVKQVVYASTGKAMRPYTPHVYAASKKASEMLMTEAAESGDNILYSGVRFTHVVDNSIIFDRLQQWIQADTPIRLHGPNIFFSVQSAKESAQLLLNSGLEAIEGQYAIQSIRDVEWPVNLVDLAVGAMAQSGKEVIPIYFCGFEDGYEEIPYPGLYPMTAVELSPLINSLEAPQATSSNTCPQVDTFPFQLARTEALADLMEHLEQVCDSGADPEEFHRTITALSWAMLDARLERVPASTLTQIAERIPHFPQSQMTNEHLRTNTAVLQALQKHQ